MSRIGKKPIQIPKGVTVKVAPDAVEVQGGEVVAKGGARYKAIQLGGSSRRMTLPTSAGSIATQPCCAR